MKAMIIVRKHYIKDLMEPEVIIQPIGGRPLQRLPEWELNRLPDSFRCYSCLNVYPKTDIGGLEHDQRLCKHCYPWLDGWQVGSIIKFDIIHHLHVSEY